LTKEDTMRVTMLVLALLGIAPAIAADEVPAGCSSMVTKIGVPEVLGSSGEREILCRTGYVLSHDDEHKTPNWVVEHLTPGRFTGPGDRKAQRDPFQPDPDLKKGKRAELVDYRAKLPNGRKFDRGHMAPAASMKFSKEAMTESFYLSNMSPQQGPGLNQHIWAELEGVVRDWSCDRGELYVITGPIYDNDNPDLLGPNEVAVPTAFYKIAYDPVSKRLIVFILPNERVDKRGKPVLEALKPYVTTLRKVEEHANLKLLTGLSTRERRRLSTLVSVVWPIKKGCTG
jgi:endonuclease G